MLDLIPFLALQLFTLEGCIFAPIDSRCRSCRGVDLRWETGGLEKMGIASKLIAIDAASMSCARSVCRLCAAGLWHSERPTGMCTEMLESFLASQHLKGKCVQNAY